MKILRTLTAAFAFLCGVCVFATAPAGYYSSLNGKKDGELKTAAYGIIHNFTTVSSYSDLPEYFRKTDVRPNSNLWWDMYSDIPLYMSSFKGLNREHSFPKSWWGGSTSVSAYVDLNHLYPSEAKANQAKSNYPLGVVDMSSPVNFNNGITKVGYPVNGQGGGAKFVFEPDDEYKGDFARTYFYMATCYQNLTWKYTYMVSQNLYPTLNQWSVNLLMQWHRQDPVSQKEIARNEAVYAIQNNRNPFIDLPELAEYIWGTKKGEIFSPGEVVVPPPAGDPELTAPSANMADLQFGEVALGNTSTTQLFVNGRNMDGPVRVRLYDGDAGMFKLSETSIPGSLVCADDGYWLSITYAPTAIGDHKARVLISGDFGSRGIGVQGRCLAVPVLSACTATAPTDIQSDRYTANWTAPDGEVIDYYVVTRTRYVGGSVYTEELVAEDNSLEIVGFDQSDREAYSVQSVRLETRSPMSNVVFVDHSGITGVETEEPLVIQTFDGCIRFICSQPQTGCQIFDPSGRLVRYIDSVHQNLDIDMSSGVYLIVTDTHRTPVKVVVR